MNWILRMHGWKKVYMFGRQLFMILGYCRARLLLLGRASYSSSELMLAHLPFVFTSCLICLFSTDAVSNVHL